MDWVELTLPAGPLAEELAAVLASTDEVAAGGLEVRGEDIVVWAPAEEAAAARLQLERAAARLRAEGFTVGEVRVAPAPPEEEWRDAWKRYFHVARLGRRLVIVPSWERFEPGPDDVVLDLDPGRAFGTGAHASTQLCLLELERLADEEAAPARFLDVGTGSGILAIAAAKLWPSAAGVAVDIDEEAEEVARENAGKNGVLGRVVVGGPAEGTFGVVTANIQADVLIGMREALVAWLPPGGVLVLSGLLSPQVADVAGQFVALGLVLLRTTESGEWSAVVLRRP